MKLSELFNPNEFAARHLSFGDEAALLEALGEKSMDDFVGNTVPQTIRPRRFCCLFAHGIMPPNPKPSANGWSKPGRRGSVLSIRPN